MNKIDGYKSQTVFSLQKEWVFSTQIIMKNFTNAVTPLIGLFTTALNLYQSTFMECWFYI